MTLTQVQEGKYRFMNTMMIAGKVLSILLSRNLRWHSSSALISHLWGLRFYSWTLHHMWVEFVRSLPWFEEIWTSRYFSFHPFAETHTQLTIFNSISKSAMLWCWSARGCFRVRVQWNWCLRQANIRHFSEKEWKSRDFNVNLSQFFIFRHIMTHAYLKQSWNFRRSRFFR